MKNFAEWNLSITILLVFEKCIISNIISLNNYKTQIDEGNG